MLRRFFSASQALRRRSAANWPARHTGTRISMARHLVVSVIALCVLSACSSPAQWTPGPIVTESATTVATTPSASPTSSATAATPTAPAVPDATGATDVSSYDFADFASPSGRIWCGLRSDLALCHFPYGMKGKVPSSNTVCPGEGLDVTGVSVDSQGRAAYFCSGDPEAFPQTSSESVAWWKPTGYPSVKYNSFTLAVPAVRQEDRQRRLRLHQREGRCDLRQHPDGQGLQGRPGGGDLHRVSPCRRAGGPRRPGFAHLR